MKKLKNAVATLKTKAYMASSALAMSAATMPRVNAASEANSMVTSIAEIVVDIFPLVGIFFVIAGAFKLIMAYRNDQPEAQTSAAKDIVIGVVLIVFRVFAWPAISQVIG